MIKYIKYFFFLILFLLNNCSFDKKSGIWTGYEDEIERVSKLEIESKIITSKIFSSEDGFSKEVLASKAITLDSPQNNSSWPMSGLNLQNSSGNLYFPGVQSIFLKKKIGKNKFNFYQRMQSPIFFENNLVMSDDEGSIKKINKQGKIYWKVRIYEKIYKRLYKNLTFTLHNNHVYVADNIGFVYVINYKNGELIWKKNFGIPFKSNIKILNNKIFIIDQDNRILCLNATDGSIIWDIGAIKTFIKSQNLLGLAISKNDKVIALNTAGDILKINSKNGHIIWFVNSLISASGDQTDFFKSSDIVVNGNDVVFSSMSSTFSLNLNNGYINWMAKPRSSNTPIIAGDNIFLVTDGGYFVNLDRATGKIVFSTNILKVLKKKARRTGISGYIMGSGKIYITTLNGYLIICSSTGKVESYKKIAKSINTAPIISNGELYILTSNSKILGFR